jgi:hypothetical protein
LQNFKLFPEKQQPQHNGNKRVYIVAKGGLNSAALVNRPNVQPPVEGKDNGGKHLHKAFFWIFESRKPYKIFFDYQDYAHHYQGADNPEREQMQRLNLYQEFPVQGQHTPKAKTHDREKDASAKR